jgi:hypothetical protein
MVRVNIKPNMVLSLAFVYFEITILSRRSNMLIGRLKGGLGSGFHGHKGRPGKVGGSTARGMLNSESKIIIPSDINFTQEVDCATHDTTKTPTAYYILPDDRVIYCSAGHTTAAIQIADSNPDKYPHARYRSEYVDNVLAAGYIRIMQAKNETAIETQNIDTKQLRNLQRLVDSGKLELADKITWAKTWILATPTSGEIAGRQSAAIDSSDFMQAKYVVFEDSNIVLKGGAGSGFYGHVGRPGKVGGSTAKVVLSSDVHDIEYAPKGLKDIDKRREEAARRIEEWQHGGVWQPKVKSVDTIIREGYKWREWAHNETGNDAWNWAMWEEIQKLAKKYGYEYKNVLTAEDVMNDLNFDASMLLNIDEKYNRANEIADQIITNRRNFNTESELAKFLQSEYGQLYKNYSLRELWGNVVRTGVDPIALTQRSFGALRHFDTASLYAGMGGLLSAKTFEEALNTPITVYRGVTDLIENPNSFRGLVSFTTSPEIAKLFAEGYADSYNKPGTGTVISRTVNFGDISVYINPDSEFEVVIPSTILNRHKEFEILKGGEGSGFFGHAGRLGKVGGSTAKGVLRSDSKRFIVPKDAWYVDPKVKDGDIRSRSFVQAWADKAASYGWDIEKLIEHAKQRGMIPQGEAYDYDPDWGLTADKEYTAWRSGSLDTKPEGTYFGPTREEIDMYVEDGEDCRSYEIILHNPKIYEDKNEAWIDLLPIPKRYLTRYEENKRYYAHAKLLPHRYAIEDADYKGQAIEANNKIDARIATALKAKGYDSMVLLDPELPCTREIMLIDPSKNLVHP